MVPACRTNRAICYIITLLSLHSKERAMYDKYQSDTTKFLNDYLQQHPEEAERRLKNRALLWDVELNAEEQEAFKAAAVAKKPYTYQPD